MKAAKCSKAQSPAGNSKKPRAMFSPHQLYKLDESFVANNFPKAKKREEIASELQMCPHSVQIWFQNRRAKDRKQRQRIKDVNLKKFIPKPPPFWPKDLPFDSNITEVIKQDRDGGSKRSDSLSMADTPPQCYTSSTTSNNVSITETHSNSQQELGPTTLSGSTVINPPQQTPINRNFFESPTLQPQANAFPHATSATNLPTPHIIHPLNTSHSSFTYCGQHNEASGVSISNCTSPKYQNTAHSEVTLEKRNSDYTSNNTEVVSKSWTKHYSPISYDTFPPVSSSTDTELLHTCTVSSDNAVLYSSQGHPLPYQKQTAVSTEVDQVNAQCYTQQRSETGQFMNSFGGYRYT